MHQRAGDRDTNLKQGMGQSCITKKRPTQNSNRAPPLLWEAIGAEFLLLLKSKSQNGELWSVVGNQAQAWERMVKNSLENRRFKLAHSEKTVLIETQILVVMSLS